MNDRTPSQLAWLFAALASVVFGLGCGSNFKDLDATHTTALGLPVDLTVQGELNFKKGDKADWKRFRAKADGRASIAVRIGDPFVGHHSVEGAIVVFDADAHPLAKQVITPDIVKYGVSWDVEEGTQYLVRLTAKKGKSAYAIDLAMDDEAGDPCDDVTCGMGEICEAGECFDPDACVPACHGGTRCVDGECWKKKARKRTTKDPCAGKRCPSGEVCRYGVCKPQAVRKNPNACDPPCTGDATCTRGKCTLEPLAAKIVQSEARGETTIIILNKGKSHQVKAGQTGKVSGVGSFKIIMAYEVRSKAVLKAPSSKLGAKKLATIYR